MIKKFEEEFNYLIELSGKVLTGQIEAEKFENQRAIFLNEYGQKKQPEIPRFVAKFIKYTADPIYEICAWAEHYGDNGSKCDDPDLAKTLDWFGMNRNLFYKAVISGYTVAKDKRFYLKNKLTGLYLYESKKGFFEQENVALELTRRCEYTQQEIDSMETGSYEQIPVEEKNG